MNPGVQAKLLAFQAKRQQQMKQSKLPSSSDSLSSSAQISNSTDLSTDTLETGKLASPINTLTSPCQFPEPIDESVSPLISKVQYANTVSSNSPLTPLSLDSSNFTSPVASPNEDVEKNPLSRRTSFRLNNNKNSKASNNNAEADIARRTSFRLNSNSSLTTAAAAAAAESENGADAEKRKSNPLPNTNIYPVNKTLLSKFQKIQSTSSSTTVSNSSSANCLPQLSSVEITKKGPEALDKEDIPSIQSKQSELPAEIVSSAPANSTSPKPTEKLSLSQRRGMKLDLGSMHSQSAPNTPRLNTEAPKPNDLDTMKNKLSSLALNNRSSMNKLRDNSGPSARKNPMNLNLSSLRGPSMRAAPNIGGGSSAPSSGNPHTAAAPAAPAAPPANAFQSNSFSTYAKYIDVKSGSLNFSGKASLHSKGIDFSNGSSFRISMDDLEILEELGHGNYGVVSKVLHRPTNIVMAMKEVRLELDDAKFSQILMELEVLHRCHTDCIVEFYGAFFVEGAVYMCMEYMEGGSIDKIYGTGIPEIPLAYITKRVVKSLKTLKDEQNIIHRDVKPTNMLVNENGIVKLCDFGVSGNLVASLARTNIGCQSYMAPERIKHSNLDVNTYSVQSDVWSLGLSILEIAKGCYPYPPETYNNVFSQLSAIVDGETPELPKDKFSSDAQDFVRRCLLKNPNKRPTYSQMLLHPWLSKYSDFEGEKMLKDIVTKEIERRVSGKIAAESETKVVPALHSGLQMQNQ